MKQHLFKILIVLGVILLLLGLFGSLNWVFDLFSHFRLYYLFYFLAVGVTALFFKKKTESTISLGFALALSLSFLLFFYPKSEIEPINGESLKITSINLLSSNENYEQVTSFIKNGDFDLVFIQELTDRWQSEFEKIEDYQFQFHIPRSDNFGFGLISKIELDSVQQIDLSDVEIPSILVNLQLQDEELSILGTHPLPPIGNRYFNSRNNQFEQINDFIEKSSNEMIVIGDLNSSVFSPNFKRLLKSGKLRDSRNGFGILPTWNAHWKLLSITLDHAFVTEGIEVISRGVGEPNGSDHLPVILEFGIKN